MDEEHTAGFSEPCAQCSAVDWGVSDEGRFYCRSCHNVIERTREVVDPTLTPGSSRVSTISRGHRTKQSEKGRQWMICEGFQMILKKQADALFALGLNAHFRDQVLCQMWRLYLQRSRQAYSHTPIRIGHFTVRGVDSDSMVESSGLSASETDGETNPSSTAGSHAESSSDWSVCSGSADAISYLSARGRRSLGLMSMRKTLALIHLALIWSREALTLSDLLRLVTEGLVPYVKAYEELPVEMRLEGKDGLLFRVESVPSHRAVHRETEALLRLLQLPAFPPVSRSCPLHPALLSLRYLRDANLPDELHPWICRLTECAGMADETLTCCGSSRAVVPRYDMQTAALIIITMKLLFGMDDATEWELSNHTSDHDHTGEQFNLRRWYRLLQAALVRAQSRRWEEDARRQWKANKPLYLNRKHKSTVMKRKRVSEQLQLCFERLCGWPGGVKRTPPSSFRFSWGDEEGADGPSLHSKKLDAVVTPRNSKYWKLVRTCKAWTSRHQSAVLEDTLPRSFVWLLQLFSFLLDVPAAYLYEEVLRVEKQVFSRWSGSRTRIGTRPRMRSQREEGRRQNPVAVGGDVASEQRNR